APWVGHARHPHDGGGDRQVQRSLVRLDTPRARRDRGLLRHPLGARTVERATGPAAVVQQPGPSVADITTDDPPCPKLTLVGRITFELPKNRPNGTRWTP